MPDRDKPFYRDEVKSPPSEESASQTSSSGGAGQALTSAKNGRIVDHIHVQSITGPLVILYGPTRIGKTVTLLRLIRHLSGHYTIAAEPNFREDPSYADVVSEFNSQRAEKIFAPASTAAFDFLLVNIDYGSSRYCQILEAPGEHFLPREKGQPPSHPHYLNEVFQGSYPKVYMLFFEPSLVANTELMERYSVSLVDTLRLHGDTRRDRIIIVYNKADTAVWLRGGRPVISQFKKHLYDNQSFAVLRNFLRSSSFRRVHFIPFSAGQFGSDSSAGQATYAMSSDHYPKQLWRAVHDSVKGGRPWWSLAR